MPQSIVEAIKYLAAASYDAGKHGATESSSVRDASNELGFAIGAVLANAQSKLGRCSDVLEVLRMSSEPLTSRPVLIDYLERAINGNAVGGVVTAAGSGSPPGSPAAYPATLNELTQYNKDSLICDGFGAQWLKCDREDCALGVVRPGRVQCEHEKCPTSYRVVEKPLLIGEPK